MTVIWSLILLAAGLGAINAVFAYQGKHVDPAFWSALKYQLLLLPVMLGANLSIGSGIKLGLKAVPSLSFVLVAAKCLEILLSVGMGYLFFREVPGWKTWAGLAVIASGLLLMKQD
ncbi:hypothetical protein HGI30_04145 [Paenibacillus albicereus]|uniref:EamA domain-containing protein n=1 Tax=Paenibacillus albicereus TaxID=2726185 RepID=A0A6H2GTS7_9BACL|nr:hypothetical protein [Paenibacillus albicereus]QJC50834.1 hypothetical protein HGI30_04145 [Paenibacillus albicereus]